MSLVRPLIRQIVSSPVSSVMRGIAADTGPRPVYVNRTIDIDSAAAATHSHVLPRSTITGNLLVLITANNNDITITAPVGWTTISTLAGAATSARGGVFVKVVDDADISKTWAFTLGSATISASHCYQIANWTGNLNDIEASLVVNTGTTNSKSCPVLQPALGRKNYMCIAAIAMSDTQTISSYPNGFIDGLHTRAGTTTLAAQIGSAYTIRNSASLAPSDFIMSSAMTSNSILMTIAIPPPASQVFSPWNLLTGEASRVDGFAGLAADAAVNGRTLPGGGGTWVADAGWVGVGDGTVKPTTNGVAVKGNNAHANCSVRLVWHPGSAGDNQVSVFCRDTQSTAFPRYGFLLSTYPAYTSAPPTQAIALYRTDDYVFTRLGTGVEDGFYEATILRDWNMMELRCVGSVISAYLNGRQIISVTDTAYTTGRSRWGFAATNQSNADARVSHVDFTVLA